MIGVLAHGVGSRSDLPLEVWQFAYAAGVALVVSFVALRALWPAPRLRAAATGRPLPALVDRAVGGAGLLAQLVVVAAYFVVLVAAWVGPDDLDDNVAPVAFYVVFWVGAQALSGLLGDVWDRLNPVATVADAVLPVGDRPEAPAWARTHWPAAGVLLVFHWLELTYHTPGSPRVIAMFLTAHLLFVVGGAARYGREWIRTADGFAVLFRLLGSLSPLHRDDAGRLRLRVPGSGLATVDVRPGTLAVILVVLGGTGFDGVSRTKFWNDFAGNARGWELTLRNSLGLAMTIATAAVVFLVAARLVDRLAGDDESLAHVRRWAPSLIPIALGYAVAHYFSLVAFEGQSFLSLASDPLGEGWNLFGTADWRVNFRLVTPNQIAWVQILGIVIGHVTGVVAAHDKALEVYVDHRRAVRSQYPLLVVMITFTVFGLYLLLNA